ncbi:hypothetical protein R3P38DRAFT_3149829 [Favolaschia claudopus]|uniref:Uncharacterized protein n=1 Tax=Favolaschia claudopus TaxID=2862362 RepID=A0AAV9Z1X4_9AGAR
MARQNSSFHFQNDNGTPSSFRGVVETTVDALRVILATRNGLISVFNPFLSKFEVRSGAVFVYRVEETGMEPWTPGYTGREPDDTSN